MPTADYPAKAPSFAELVEIGATDMRVWAIEFDPPVSSPRSPSGKNKPVKWKGCITSADISRPMVVAIRATAKEAEEDVKRGFWQHFANRPHRYPPPAKPLDFPPDPEPYIDGMELI